MKKILTIIGVIIILLVVLLVGKTTYNFSSHAVTPQNGITGDCEWNIDSEGNLVVKPTAGNAECTMDSTNPNATNSSPWHEYNEIVTSVAFEGTVHAGASINHLFYWFVNLERVDLTNFDTSNTTNMQATFFGCTSLKEIDFSNFDNRNVGENGFHQFIQGVNLKKITIGDNFNFYANKTDSQKGSVFGRGTWLKKEDGQLYNAVDIALNNIKGTFIKQSDIIEEMTPNYDIDYKVQINNASVDESSIVKSSENIIFNNNMFRIINLKNISESNYNSTEYFEFIMTDAVSDKNETKYNLKIKVDNIRLYDFDGLKDIGSDEGIIADILKVGKTLDFISYPVTPSNNYLAMPNNGRINPSSAYDITIQILDKNGNPVEGNFIFSAFDIDASSQKDGGYGNYSEGINLISGYDPNSIMTHSKGNIVINDIGNGQIRLYGSRTDESSELSEFIVKANANGFKFAWTGSTCSTETLSFYQPKTVEIEKQDNNGNKVSGAVLGLYDKDDVLVENWTTANENKRLFLNPGRYVLKETSAPEHYTQGDNVEFYVDIEDRLTVNGESKEKIVLVNTLKKYSFTVNYFEKGTNKVIKTAKISEAEYLSTINANDEIVEIGGYIYDSVDKESLVIKEDNNVLNIFYVRKKNTVIVKYVDIDTNEEISERVVITDEIGKDYTTSKKEFDDYTFVKNTDNTSGIISEDDIEVIYYYQLKPGLIEVKYVDEDGNELFPRYKKRGLTNETYNTRPEEIPGYDYFKVDGEEEGFYKEEGTTIIYYYKKAYQIKTAVVNGNIDPDVVLRKGEETTIKYMPKEGYIIQKVLIDGEEVDISKYPDSYTFKNIDKDHEVLVVYEKINNTVNVIPKTNDEIFTYVLILTGAVIIIVLLVLCTRNIKKNKKPLDKN